MGDGSRPSWTPAPAQPVTPRQAPRQGEPGRLLAGRYELVELLGRGGMADVYRANDRTLSRPVAVKVLREGAPDDAERRRFVGEARTLARLSHSGLVTLLDAGFGDSAGTAPGGVDVQPYLVMELVEGPTLARRIAHAPLPLEELGSLGGQIAEALAYVHGHGIVHRDVKPANVLLGPDGRARLADFGIARLLEGGTRHTMTGQAIGTAAYLAPEQVTGSAVSGATDVYSLGLVLLEAFTGRREYPGTPTESAVARLNRAPVIPAHLPPAWQNLLRDMTALDPGARPAARLVAAAIRDQPTAPIPAATRPVPVPDEAVQDEPVPDEPMPDRAGDAIARHAVGAVRRVGRLPSSTRAALLTIVGVLLVLVVVAVVGRAGDNASDLPDNTPSELVDPLQRLHDAVDGSGR